jgi:hypothetical protein
LGDAPADAVEVVVAEDGAPYLGGARVEAERFEAALRAAVGAPAAGTADVERDVIVRVAAETPWRAVARVRRACRAVGAWRVHVAVVGEGDGAEGAMALFLPVEAIAPASRPRRRGRADENRRPWRSRSHPPTWTRPTARCSQRCGMRSRRRRKRRCGCPHRVASRSPACCRRWTSRCARARRASSSRNAPSRPLVG